MFCAKEGKTTYKTVGEARAAIRGRKAEGRTTTDDLHIYACGDHFHLTKQVLIRSKYTVPKLKVQKTDEPMTKAEWKHLKNRVADLTRQFQNEEYRVAQKKVRELASVVAEDREWLRRMKDAAEYHEACAKALRVMLDAHFDSQT